MSTLTKLLDKLRERQSWCPMCGHEMVCDTDCELRDRWFTDTDEDEEEDD